MLRQEALTGRLPTSPGSRERPAESANEDGGPRTLSPLRHGPGCRGAGEEPSPPPPACLPTQEENIRDELPPRVGETVNEATMQLARHPHGDPGCGSGNVRRPHARWASKEDSAWKLPDSKKQEPVAGSPRAAPATHQLPGASAPPSCQSKMGSHLHKRGA